MRRSVLMTALLAIIALPGTVVWADQKQDLCHARAQKDSGYKSQGPKIATQSGGVQMRLSGSAGLGVSTSRGAPSSTPTAPFAGSAATERRETDAQARYQRLFDACMNNR